MSYTYIFEPGALTEYKEAVEWYIARSETAAENLITEVKSRIEAICDDPLRYRNTYKNFRETSLKKYPYYLVYFVDENIKTVIITSLYHHKRNPKKKYRK
jgi:plasmid stabilization system protein ParE